MLTKEHSSAHQNVRLYVLQGKPLLGVKKKNNKKGGGVASKRCRETLELSGKKAVNELLAIQNTSSGLWVQKRKLEGWPVSLVKHLYEVFLSSAETHISFIPFSPSAKREQSSLAQHQVRGSKCPKAPGLSASPGNDVGRDAQHRATRRRVGGSRCCAAGSGDKRASWMPLSGGMERKSGEGKTERYGIAMKKKTALGD